MLPSALFTPWVVSISSVRPRRKSLLRKDGRPREGESPGEQKGEIERARTERRGCGPARLRPGRESKERREGNNVGPTRQVGERDI
jgi:hypothetical protein